MKATLVGTVSNPGLTITYGDTERAPGGGQVSNWIRELPGRQWDRSLNRWVVSCFGMTPDKALRTYGIELVIPDDVHSSLAGVTSLNELLSPLVKRSNSRPSIALVRPRFSGYDRTVKILGHGATWDKEHKRFEVRLADLVTNGAVDKRLTLLGDLEAEAIAAASVASPVRVGVAHHAAAAALSTGLEMDARENEALDALIADIGDVPEWFDMNLYPYQRLGAIAAAAGRGSLNDSPGLGKTRQALAAAAIRQSVRTLIVVPPVVVTNWVKETNESGLPAWCAGDVVSFSARRKEPELPERGVVVVPDSLLTSRQALAERLIEWAPETLIIDEVHRARNWTSKRSMVLRDIADRLPEGSSRIGISGTPIFSSPHELAPLLAITGHLDPVFGGFSNFLETYCRQNHFKAWVPRKNMLPQLRQMLNDHVWVRRLKADVLKDLPPKSRVGTFVDVDLKDYRTAHEEISEKLVQWLVEFHRGAGRFPTDDEQTDWAKDNIGAISPLRKAAGLAKVPHALDVISDWVANNHLDTPAEDGSLYDRPLVVWAHHQPVVAALKEGIRDAKPGVAAAVEIIDGATSAEKRGRIVDDFQAGKIGVIIASITAAGVGITLTRGSDSLFVETDWTPAMVSQAEDRQARIGQTMPVICQTLIAADTLDEHIQAVLIKKAETLNEVLGGDEADVATAGSIDLATPSEIIVELLRGAMKKAVKQVGRT